MTKSGQRRQNEFRLPLPSSAIRDFSVQDASGERRAPLGRTKPVEESQPIPRRSFLAHSLSWPATSKLQAPVSEWVGAITMSSPSAVISKLTSGCAAQKAVNSSSVIGGAVKVAGSMASSMANVMASVYLVSALPARNLAAARSSARSDETTPTVPVI